jgi:hypothetical protein
MDIKVVVPICQDCGEELRLEHLIDDEDRGYTSGYCTKCAKHNRLCSASRYMRQCVRRKDHDGNHLDSDNHTWNGEYHYNS